MKIEDLPPRVLKFLGPLEKVLIKEKRIVPTNDANYLRDIAKDLLFKNIQPYYEQFQLEANNGIFNFLVEPLKNANFHGGANAKNPIKFKVIMTPKALVASYQDRGSYFTRQDVKQAYEKRIQHSEKHHVENKEIGYGAGTVTIYELSELIHVETTTGTLFTGISTSTMFFNKL